MKSWGYLKCDLGYQDWQFGSPVRLPRLFFLIIELWHHIMTLHLTDFCVQKRPAQFFTQKIAWLIQETTNKTNCREESYFKNYWLYLLIHKIRNLPAAFRSVLRSKLSRLFSCIDRQTCVHFPPQTSHITFPGDWSPLQCTHAFIYALL